MTIRQRVIGTVSQLLRKEGVLAFLLFFMVCCVVWALFLSFFVGEIFVPHPAPDDDTMHKTVIYFMLRGEDFYTAWRHAAVACMDLSDLRIYRTPLVFYAILILTGWSGDAFVFPLSVLCVLVAAGNLILSFWTTRAILGSGWAGLTAALTQYAFFYNVIPRFQLSLFGMPFLILSIYWMWQSKHWLASGSVALAFLIKEIYAFAFPALLVYCLIRGHKRHMLIYLSIFATALGLYLLHNYIAHPITDPNIFLVEPLHLIFANTVGFIWFGFITLYYNILLPITIGGRYLFSPISPVLPYSIFLILISSSVLLIWIPIIWWVLQSLHQRKFSHAHLGLMAFILWFIPLVFAATAPITVFPLWWVDFSIWRWFAASYVGFQLLVGIGWHNLRQHLKKPALSDELTQATTTIIS